MKTATLKILLFQFEELSHSAKEKAIQDHYNFLVENSFEAQDENGNVPEAYDPTEKEVIENIEANEYYFYSNGNLAHTVTYTGKHPMTGQTHYINGNHKVLI